MRGSCFSAFLRNFGAGMITDIRDIENFDAYSDPLFEYVRNVADNFWPDYEGFSDVPDMFSRRFSMGVIDDSWKQKYLATTEVLDTIKAFGLDISKFWYLCLFIKDIADTTAANAAEVSLSPREAITDLIEKMDKMNPQPFFYDVSNGDGTTTKILADFKTERNALLTFKVEGSKRLVKIEDPRTISIINAILSDFLHRCTADSSLLDSAVIEHDSCVTLKPIHKIYLFDKYLSWFIKDLKADKGVQYSRVSLNKRLLVSRMIFVLGISDDESFFDEYKENNERLNFLHDYLTKYKNKELPISNKAYWISV